MASQNCVINPKTKRAVRADGKIGRGLIGASNTLAAAVRRELDSKKPPPKAPLPKTVFSSRSSKPVKKTREELIDKGKALLKKFQDKKNKDDDLKYSLSEFKKLKKQHNFNTEGGKNAYKVKAYIFRNNAETFANKIKQHHSKLTDKEKMDLKSEELDHIVSGKYFSTISDYYNTTTKL